MDTRDVVVACCQVRPVLGDVDANIRTTVRAIRHAASQGAQVVVLPELVASGYVFSSREEALTAARRPSEGAVAAWAAVAEELGLVIVGGFCELDPEGQPRNSAALVDPSGLRAVYRKVHLWDRERLIFTAGEEPPPVVDTVHGRIGVMVCYDLEFPEWVRVPALAGAQLLCVPVNWPREPRPAGERPGEIVRVQADAMMNRMCIAACDRVGPERGADWVGGSTIVDADGWPLAGGHASEEEATLIARVRISDSDVKDIGTMSSVHGDRRPDLYRTYLD